MKDSRAAVILFIGAVLIAVSLAACTFLLSNNDHKVTFLSDRDNIAYGFVIEDRQTGEVHPLEKGAEIYDGAIIRCISEDFEWKTKPWIDANANMVECICTHKGSWYSFVLWTNGANIMHAEVIEGQLTLDIEKMHYCMAMSLSITEHEPVE